MVSLTKVALSQGTPGVSEAAGSAGKVGTSGVSDGSTPGGGVESVITSPGERAVSVLATLVSNS